MARPERPTPVPRQIPEPPNDFTGREHELDELRAAAGRGGPVAIFGLRGTGGVGKTTLALALARELAPHYPNGQVYLDLKGVTTPLSTDEAQAHVIRAFDLQARVPEGEAERVGLYRTVLHGRRALLLMDNAKDRQQVEPLLPPAGCALLITSRFHFQLPGGATLDLDELAEQDARALLLRIAPRIGEAAGEIARLCGCLPFALRLAGSALADWPQLAPADYARRLGTARHRFAEVDASLALSYELLRPELRPLWCRLAVFPGTFDAEAAAAVWGLEGEPAADALGELGKSSMIEWEETIGRFRLHDLARLFAEARLGEEDRTEAQRRHAIHYLEVLRRANVLYERGGPGILQGLGRFDLEWENIQAGQAWAAAGSADEDEAARLCSDYPDTGVSCLTLRQHSRDWIRWLEAALTEARKRGDRAAEGRHLNHMGMAYADLGEWRRAIDLYQQALTISREIGDYRAEGNALGNMGNAYADLGESRHAIDLYEQVLTITRKIGDRRGEGNTLGNMGVAYSNLGNPPRAIDLYEQLLIIYREIGDRRGEGITLGNMGIAYVDLGEPRRAIDLYELQLTITSEIGDRRGEGNALGNMGNAYNNLGEPRRAIDLYEQQLAITREIGDRHGEGSSLGNLGNAYAALSEPRRAINFYEQHLALTREIGDRLGQGNALGNLGLAYANLGELRRAIDFYEQHLAIAREIGDRVGEARASWNLGLALEVEEDLERAAALMEIRVAYRREIGHPGAAEDAARVKALRSRLARERRGQSGWRRWLPLRRRS